MAELNSNQFPTHTTERPFSMTPRASKKKGGQGSLFQGGPREDPWHRGYSPERLNEVRAATKGIVVAMQVGPTALPYPSKAVVKEHYEGGGHHAVEHIVQSSQQLRNVNDLVGHPTERFYTNLENQQRTSLNDMVARSSVPVSDLEGLYKVSTRPRNRSVAGNYEVGRGVINLFPSLDKPRGSHMESTLAHEIGHHVDYTSRGGDLPYRTQGEQGRAEGRADQYSVEHTGIAREHGYGKSGAQFNSSYWAERLKSGNAGRIKSFGNMDTNIEPVAVQPALDNDPAAFRDAHLPLYARHAGPVFKQPGRTLATRFETKVPGFGQVTQLKKQGMDPNSPPVVHQAAIKRGDAKAKLSHIKWSEY